MSQTITHITTARRWRAMNWLITTRMGRQGYSDQLIRVACDTSRQLYTDGHCASRAMRLAMDAVARLQMPGNPNQPGPRAA